MFNSQCSILIRTEAGHTSPTSTSAALPNESPDPKFATVGAVYDRPYSQSIFFRWAKPTSAENCALGIKHWSDPGSDAEQWILPSYWAQSLARYRIFPSRSVYRTEASARMFFEGSCFNITRSAWRPAAIRPSRFDSPNCSAGASMGFRDQDPAGVASRAKISQLDQWKIRGLVRTLRTEFAEWDRTNEQRQAPRRVTWTQFRA